MRCALLLPPLLKERNWTLSTSKFKAVHDVIAVLTAMRFSKLLSTSDPCPCCGSEKSILVGGEELDLAYVEVEEA